MKTQHIIIIALTLGVLALTIMLIVQQHKATKAEKFDYTYRLEDICESKLFGDCTTDAGQKSSVAECNRQMQEYIDGNKYCHSLDQRIIDSGCPCLSQDEDIHAEVCPFDCNVADLPEYTTEADAEDKVTGCSSPLKKQTILDNMNKPHEYCWNDANQDWVVYKKPASAPSAPQPALLGPGGILKPVAPPAQPAAPVAPQA